MRLPARTRRRWTTLLGCVLALHAAARCVLAKDATVETIATDFDDPNGIAVLPGDASAPLVLVVAETGKRQIIRITDEKSPATLVTGFTEDALPLTVFALDRENIVVGCGGVPALKRFELTGETEPLTADAAKQSIPLAVDPSEAKLSVRKLRLARTRANDKVPDALIAVAGAEQEFLRPSRIAIRAGTLNPATNLKFHDDQLADLQFSAVAVNEMGYVVFAQLFSNSSTDRSRLVFINPIDNNIALTVSVSLPNIQALAFSPQTTRLYALANRSDSNEAGIYRIDDDFRSKDRSAKITKIAGVEGAKAFVFSSNGTLYVTASDVDKKGKLLRIRGDL